MINRNFNTMGSNKKWCKDVTVIISLELVILPIINLYDRFLVSLEVTVKNDAILVN